LSGVVDAGYQSIKNFGGQQTNQVGQNGARTSTFKFNGTEDLGGGQSANFQFEVQPSYIAGNGNAYNATVAAGTTAPIANGSTQGTNQASAQSGLVGKGQSFVGLKDAKYGEVQFGTINTATFGAFAAVSHLGTGVGTGYGSGNTFGDITRVESSLAYKSPSIAGFDFSVLKGTNNDSQFGVASSTATGVTLRRPRVLDLGIGYTNGPLAVKFGRLESTATANEGAAGSYKNGLKTTTQLLGAAYDAGVAKVALATGSIKNDATDTTHVVDNKLTVAAVTVPFGANRVIAQYGTNAANGNSISYNTGLKAKTTGLAFERDLSKRTYVYVRYEKTDLAAFAASGYIVNGAAVAASSTTAAVGWGSTDPQRTVTTVGLSHAF